MKAAPKTCFWRMHFMAGAAMMQAALPMASHAGKREDLELLRNRCLHLLAGHAPKYSDAVTWRQGTSRIPNFALRDARLRAMFNQIFPPNVYNIGFTYTKEGAIAWPAAPLSSFGAQYGLDVTGTWLSGEDHVLGLSGVYGATEISNNGQGDVRITAQ